MTATFKMEVQVVRDSDVLKMYNIGTNDPKLQIPHHKQFKCKKNQVE